MNQLTSHFTLSELTRSSTAARLGLDNRPPAEVVPALIRTAQMLERIRTHLSVEVGRPVRIRVTSGFRCLGLNRVLKSADTSAHVKGLAADWTADDFGTPYEVCRALAPMVGVLQIGQLIHEHGEWIHTGVQMPEKAINRIITVGRSGTRPGIVEA